MKNQLRTVIWCTGILAASGITSPAAGQGQDAGQITTAGVTVLDGITVKGDTLATALPPGSTVVNSHQLRARNITDWTDFSRRGDPAVNFNRNNNSINIRGMDADRVVTRIDGVRLPWLDDGARDVKGGLNAVSFGSLSSVSILKGAGSVRSGSLAGTVDLETLAPLDILSPDQNFGALLGTGYDSADRSWRADAALAGRVGADTRWLLQLGTRQGDELRNHGGEGGYGDGRIKTNPQDYREYNVLLKLEHDISAEHRLSVSGERFRRRSEIDNRRAQGAGTQFALGENSTLDRTERDRLLLGYDYQAADSRASLAHGHLKTYWQRQRLKSLQDGIRTQDGRASIIPGDPFSYGYPSGPYSRHNMIQESGFGVATEWGGYLDTAFAQHHWLLGADWYDSRTRQESSGYDNCPATLSPFLPSPFGPRSCELLHTNQADVPRVKGQAWSVWAQDEISWSDGRYSVTPALRFDAYRFRPENEGNYAQNPNAEITALSSNSDQRVSPSLLARWRPSDTLTLYASYAYGFKAPNASQLYLNYGAPGSYLIVGNPDLKPEISRGWELGVVAGDSELNGRLSVFQNRYRDFIDSAYAVAPGDSNWNPAWDGQYPMGVTMAVNRSRVRIYGAEASGHWQITPQWYSRASIVWTRGKDLDTNRPLNAVAPLKAALAFGYSTPVWGAETLVSAAARHSRVENENDFKAPGYGVTDLTAWWTPPAIKGLRLQAGIYNLFDKKYWDALNIARSGRDAAPADYYTEPGRSVRISLSYQY